MRAGARLTKQVAGSTITSVWLMLLGLLTTPYILLGVGNAAYGVLALVGVVSIHLSNFEFGFGQAAVRYLARARATGNTDRELVILETSLAVLVAGGLAAAILLFAGAPYLVSDVFDIDASLQQEALIVFRLGAVILGCSFVSSFCSAVLQAGSRFIWLNGSRAVSGTAAAATTVGVVAAGGGIEAILLMQAGIACLSSVTLAVVVMRSYPRVIRPRVTRGVLQEMGAYAILAFIGSFAYQWMINGAPLILAVHVSAAALPAFSVPHLVLQKLTVLMGSASLVFLPFASAASDGADRSRLRVAFESHLRLTILVMGPMTGYLAVFAPALLGAWVNPEFGRAAAPCLRLLAAGALVLALSGPPADVARAFGRPGWVLAYTSGVAGLGLVISLVAIPLHGTVGAAFAFFASVLVGTGPLLLVVAQRFLGLGMRDLARILMGPSAAVGVVTALYMAGAVIGGGLIGALISGAVATAAYVATGFLWVLTPIEREALQQVAT